MLTFNFKCLNDIGLISCGILISQNIIIFPLSFVSGFASDDSAGIIVVIFVQTLGNIN